MLYSFTKINNNQKISFCSSTKKMQPEVQSISQTPSPTFTLHPQLPSLLSYQYMITFPETNAHLQCQEQSYGFTYSSLLQYLNIALKKSLYLLKYSITWPTVEKYGMKLEANSDPFREDQRDFLKELVRTCQSIQENANYSKIGILSNYIKQSKMKGFGLSSQYAIWQWRLTISVKQVLMFTVLSRSNVWYTIVKNRKKSKKQFELDDLIQWFEGFVVRLGLKNPYHIDILPKKQVKNIQRKINKEKITNELFEAVSNGDCELAKELLLKGAKIQMPAFLNNRQKIEVRCVHKACLMGDLKMCKLLDSFGANWQSLDSQQMTPIFYAVQSGSLPVLKYLVEQLHVQIEKQQIQKRTPFYWACTQGDIEIIDYLYKAGSNVNQKSQLGRTALSKSCYLGRRDIVVYLLGCKQIDMFSQCKKGRTALHNAVFGPKGGREGHKFGTNQKDSPQCAQILLQKGMHVDILDFEDCTPLHIAMSSDAIQSIRLLLAYGASLKVRNNYGEVPLMTGAKFGHVEACKILYEQFNCDILCRDIFDKNVLLLTAKFQQNNEGEGTINPVYLYFLQPFILQCIKHNKVQQELHRTFLQIINNEFAQKMIVELTALWKCFEKHNVPLPSFELKQIQKIIELIMLSPVPAPQHPHPHPNLSPIFPLAKQYLQSLPEKISAKRLHELHLWLIKKNQPKILQFLHEHGLLGLDGKHFRKQTNKMHQSQPQSQLQTNSSIISTKQLFHLIQNDQVNLKQRVVSFLLLSMNFNWPLTPPNSNNILHILVSKNRTGCLIQLFKSLANKIPQKILTNPHIPKPPQSHILLRNLLSQTNSSGLTPYQLSLILKNKSLSKMLEQKLMEEHMGWEGLDVGEYRVEVEADAEELEKFGKHEAQAVLGIVEEYVGGKGNGNAKAKDHKMGDKENLQEMVETVIQWKGVQDIFKFKDGLQDVLQGLRQSKKDKGKGLAEQFWNYADNRPLHYISKVQHLPILTCQSLVSSPVLGLDLQYFPAQTIPTPQCPQSHPLTLISILQISTLTQDYIIDILSLSSLSQSQVQNQGISKLKPYLQNLFHSPSILKIMHGADNDLILLKSLFNLSMVCFVDTSRLDLDIRVGGDGEQLRGLATLVKEYIGISMSKEYQVSEWRIRPLPKAMLQYARKDSMILPYLLAEMLNHLKVQLDKLNSTQQEIQQGNIKCRQQYVERLKNIILSGCKQCRRNRKNFQPLVKRIIQIQVGQKPKQNALNTKNQKHEESNSKNNNENMG